MGFRRRLMSIDYDFRRRVAAHVYEFWCSLLLGVVATLSHLGAIPGGLAAGAIISGTKKLILSSLFFFFFFPATRSSPFFRFFFFSRSLQP